MICQSRGSACRVLRSLNSIPHFLALVKGFLKSFSNFFAVFLLVHQPPLFWPLFDSLHIIALLFLFVKRFFASFFTLETIAVCHKNVVAVLCKLTAIAFLHRKISPPPEGEGLPYRHLTISALQARYFSSSPKKASKEPSIPPAPKPDIYSSICSSLSMWLKNAGLRVLTEKLSLFSTAFM